MVIVLNASPTSSYIFSKRHFCECSALIRALDIKQEIPVDSHDGTRNHVKVKHYLVQRNYTTGEEQRVNQAQDLIGRVCDGK